MSKTIICSVGTSASKKLGVRPRELKAWVDNQSSVSDAVNKILESFCDFEPTDDNLTEHLSAEIHSLVRIGIDQSDHILLFASETSDGYVCALAVEKYLQHHWSGIKVETQKISGLQVNDAEIFQSQGVVEFVKKATHVIESYGSGNVILNPTGGYKALVPYTVLLGMLKGVKCCYIFEQSTSILELPPLPVEFKRSQFEAYKGIFEKIERECSIPRQEWENSVSYEERQILSPLIEKSGQNITLSAVGFLFLGEMKTHSVFVPYLSRKAIEDCFYNIGKLDDCDPFRFLMQVSKSEEALRQKEHINVRQGLRWLKPGRTTDRYLVSVEGWRLLVWRVIREDQEGKEYASNIEVNPERDRPRYLPFIRMDYLNE